VEQAWRVARALPITPPQHDAGSGDDSGADDHAGSGGHQTLCGPGQFASYCRTVARAMHFQWEAQSENNRKLRQQISGLGVCGRRRNLRGGPTEQTRRWYDRKAAKTARDRDQGAGVQAAKAAWHVMAQRQLKRWPTGVRAGCCYGPGRPDFGSAVASQERVGLEPL